MKTICWKGKTLKQLSVNKKRKSAGRNSSGTITSYHRGGGSKRLLRRIDSKRNVFLFNKSMKGIVRRIEYDPNRSSRIALIQWHFFGASIEKEKKKNSPLLFLHEMPFSYLSETKNKREEQFKKTTVIYSSDVLNKNIDKKTKTQTQTLNNSEIETPYCYSPTKNKVDKKFKKKTDSIKPAIFSYILACDQLQLGDTIMNLALTQGSYKLSSAQQLQLFFVEQPLFSFFQKHPKKKSLTAATGNSSSSSSLSQLTQQSSLVFFKAKTETLNDTLNLDNCSLPSVKKTNSSCEENNTNLDRNSLKKKTAVWSNATSWKQKATSANTKKSLPSFFAADAETEVLSEGKSCKKTAEEDASVFNCSLNTLPFQDIVIRKKAAEDDSSYCFAFPEEEKEEQKNVPMHDTFYQKPGNCIPLYNIAIGTFIYNIEINPGQGGKLVKAAGTFAQLVQQFQNTKQCLIRLPSGITKLLDSRCQATIGTVSNIGHAMRKLTKAGQNRWLGKRPVVRGVAMNPVDHPHGGGEGRTKGGRPSVSPWGKPTKGGFKTVALPLKKKINKQNKITR